MAKKKSDIETLLDSTLREETHMGEPKMPELKIEVNLIETENEFIVEAPLPGIPKCIHLSSSRSRPCNRQIPLSAWSVGL